MKWKTIAAGTLITLGASTVPSVPVPDGYYVREAPASEAQFSKVDRNKDLKGLKEAHIIGSACYDRFTDPKKKPIRERIDCEEYWKRANTPNYPTPTKHGMVWSSYVTHLFDTPSGDLEEGYYAKSDDVVNVSPAQLLLDQTPQASAAISLDATSAATLGAAVTSLSWTHTVSASASTTLLAVGLTMEDATDADRTVTVLTFNGDSLFKVREDDENTDNISTTVWQLPDPDLGAKTVAATLNGTVSGVDGAALSIHGVDHNTSVDAQASSASDQGSVVGQLTTVANNSWLFVAGVTINYGAALGAYALQPNTTGILNFEDTNRSSHLVGYFGPQTPAGTASSTWTCSGTACTGNDWITSNVSFDPNCNSAGDICSQWWRASGTWVASANLTSVDVACWGAGGAGAGNASTKGGGGGGGGFASSTISVTGGNSYAIVVGVAAAANSASTAATSSFNGTSVVADGGDVGKTGDSGAGGRAGLASLSTGTAEFNGGTGGTAAALGSSSGGGGGGAAGPHGAGAVGSNGSGTTGGTGGTGDNTLGGAGGTEGLPGNASLVGGGGGGGADSITPTGAGAVIGGGGGGSGGGTVASSGATGACLLVWTYPSAGGGGGGFIDNLIMWFTED